MSRSLAEEIELIVKNVANNNPAPKKCIIHDVYPDGSVDVLLDNQSNPILYRSCIGTPEVGDEAIICFIEGSINRGYVICNSNIIKEDLITILNEIVVEMINLEEGN